MTPRIITFRFQHVRWLLLIFGSVLVPAFARRPHTRLCPSSTSGPQAKSPHCVPTTATIHGTTQHCASLPSTSAHTSTLRPCPRQQPSTLPAPAKPTFS